MNDLLVVIAGGALGGSAVALVLILLHILGFRR